ncbi:unnamed protein product [Heligmosomoides polygyrus]|uniref:DNA_LIGASE_A3 domain-containing protein n=1 Tax=Heligmosomoides polygyrus TaxID=6339 RepID=A0A183GAE9_HELPZ|nr:unnamed protein product [Heligmosomoides polygyrus]
MREKEVAVISRVQLPTVTTVDETWKKATDAIREAARLELGTTKPGRRKVDKQIWLWTDDVKAKVREKKSLYHVFLCDRTADNWRNYQEARKAAKKAVAVAKATHYGDVNEKLESRDGERYLYRLAKSRHRQTEGIEKFSGINDESGHLLTDHKKALKRCDYFEGVSTMEFPHPAIPSLASVHGPVHKITVEKTEAALRKMRPGKANGPDEVAADLWKSKLCYPAERKRAKNNRLWPFPRIHADGGLYEPNEAISFKNEPDLSVVDSGSKILEFSQAQQKNRSRAIGLPACFHAEVIFAVFFDFALCEPTNGSIRLAARETLIRLANKGVKIV